MDPVLTQLGRLAVALLFADAAYHKARDLSLFETILADYRLLPSPVVIPAARCLISIEIGLCIALLFHSSSGFAALGAAAILTAYSFAIVINLARGRREIDCGCGGEAGQALRPGLLARNALLILVALASALPASNRTLSILDIVTLTSGLFVLALIWRASGQLSSFPISLYTSSYESTRGPNWFRRRRTDP